MRELLGCLLGISPLGEIPAGAKNYKFNACMYASGAPNVNYSGRKNVLRKPLRIAYRRLKAGTFCVLTVLTVLVCCWSWVKKCTRCERLLPVKHFYLTCLLFVSSLENYFGFRTTNVKGKTDHSVSLRWNKRFWTFLKRRVFFLIVHPINLWVDFAGLNKNPLVFCH